MEIKEYQLIDIDKIIVNPENPRHNPVINLDETFIMQQLVTNTREANAMYKLITDIFKDGWYAQSIITVTYDEQKDKYVAWDGNRRTTALKILKYPQLLKVFSNFNHSQKMGIQNMSKNIKDNSFFQIPCYVSDSFDDCKGYIKNIHTNDTGALRWDTAAIKRFEEKLGIKNIFAQLQGYCPKAFSKVGKDFPVSKFEKIASTKIGKEYLNIEFIDNTVTCLSSIEDLEEKVSKIIDDINNNIVKTETVKNISSIKAYLYPKIDDNQQSISQNKEYNIKEDNLDNKLEENFEQANMFEGKNSNNIKQGKSNNIFDNLMNKLKSNRSNEQITNENNNSRLIRKNDDILFKNIDISKMKEDNERYKGIKDLCYEIKYLSSYNQYRRFPISYCFLIRALLEQSAIYFLINKEKWDKLVKSNNNRDLRLEKIIECISKDKNNLIDNDTILRCWETCFNSEGTKNYLDLVIHHPYKIIANTESIKSITDMGMFAIIQYLING